MAAIAFVLQKVRALQHRVPRTCQDTRQRISAAARKAARPLPQINALSLPLQPPSDDEYRQLPYASKVLFQSELVQIGATRCPADHPDFASPGPIQRHAFYLGGSPVRVSSFGAPDFLASSASVSFHNRGDEVKRSSVPGGGDYSNWFALDPELLYGTLGTLQPGAKVDEERPFCIRTGPCSPRSYLTQKRLIDSLQAAQPLECVQAEEIAIALLQSVLEAALSTNAKSMQVNAHTARRHRDLVEHTKFLLCNRYRQALSLSSIARAAGTSAFHLARVFRACTGWSLHAYLTQLRLNAALDAVCQGAEDLTELALELGFSSHSHFSSSFKRAFGCCPSSLRAKKHARRARS